MILHCMKRSTYEQRKDKAFWGARNLTADGFIHCSQPEYFWRVVPNFCSEEEELVIVCIDEKKLQSEVRYEDEDGCGRSYPHIYGPVNHDAVTAVLPFLRAADGSYLKNPELAEFVNQ